ncbi:MAG: MarR family transcriptional regulator [Streptococcaceae bacterium]|jgi:DNA-binding MarR family transcriptional regulator|nr:MarR family transcriptional regulator [Streptococcaceae bacterium]
MEQKINELLESGIDIYLHVLKDFEQFASRATKEIGITFDQYLVMRDLHQRNNSAISSEIAKKRGITQGAITRQIKVLLAKGYITQERDVKDSRRQLLHLTDAGKKAEKKGDKAVTERFNEWVSIIGEDKTRQAFQILLEFGNKIVQKGN